MSCWLPTLLLPACPPVQYRWNVFRNIRSAIDQNEGGLQQFSQGAFACVCACLRKGWRERTCVLQLFEAPRRRIHPPPAMGQDLQTHDRKWLEGCDAVLVCTGVQNKQACK